MRNQSGARLPAGLLAEVEARGPRATIIRRDLERYYALLKAGRRELRRTLSGSEVMAVVDFSNGIYWDAWSIGLVWANVADALPDGRGEKRGIDGPALVAKLKAQSFAADAALVDACERFWLRAGSGTCTEREHILDDPVPTGQEPFVGFAMHDDDDGDDA